MEAQKVEGGSIRRQVTLTRLQLSAVAQCAHEWFGEMDDEVACRVIHQLDRADEAPHLGAHQPNMFVMLSVEEATALMHACAWALVELTTGVRDRHEVAHRMRIVDGMTALAWVAQWS